MKKIVFFFFFLPSLIWAEYPLIEEIIIYKDIFYKQQQAEIESWYFHDARGNAPPPFSIYRYKPKPGENLVILAAAFSLPVDTLATINSIENVAGFEGLKEILVPSAPGLYLDSRSHSTWMTSLRNSLLNEELISLILQQNDENIHFDYYMGFNLPRAHKTRFIQSLFLSPLESRFITSAFGYRDHPVTGIWGLHTGTDYRAPIGTDVVSCADGLVLSTGQLEDYGKFVIIKHKNGFTSMYSHLKMIYVIKNESVSEGELIAETGNTGISTGPHLHFELRQNGVPLDPENLLFSK